MQKMAQSVAFKLISVDYEVFGKVQGVFFRKFTHVEAQKLKLVGWVMNTKQNTVIGQMQGPEADIKKMKDWLKNKGSPQSRIDKAEFKNEKSIEKPEFTEFTIRKENKEKS